MWSDKAELELTLRNYGLGDWAPKLAAEARHCILLVPSSVEEGTGAPVGTSRLGGNPDLPPDIEWPIRPAVSDDPIFDHSPQPWPLSFVAQIDFAELHAEHALEDFPDAGRLWLFADSCDHPWGEGQEDQTRARTFFRDIPAEMLQRRPYPQEFDQPQPLFEVKHFVFKPRRLRPKAWLLPPPMGSFQFFASVDKGPEEWAHDGPIETAYERFWDELATRHPDAFGPNPRYPLIHQVGGMPFSIQDPVEVDCVKFADDDYRNLPEIKAWWRDVPKVGSPEYQARLQRFQAYGDEQRPTHFARAGSWQLILQIDSGRESRMHWGGATGGYIYARASKMFLPEISIDVGRLCSVLSIFGQGSGRGKILSSSISTIAGLPRGNDDIDPNCTFRRYLDFRGRALFRASTCWPLRAFLRTGAMQGSFSVGSTAIIGSSAVTLRQPGASRPTCDAVARRRYLSR